MSGSGGIVMTNLGGNDEAYALRIQSDGQLVVAGTSNVGGSNDFALARYNPNGTLDNMFGTGGLVTTNFGGTANDLANALAIQSDGKLVAAGTSNARGSNDFAPARYNPN